MDLKLKLIPTVLGLMALHAVLPPVARALQQGERGREIKGVGLPVSDRLRKIFAGGEPETLEDLRAMQAYGKKLLEKILPAMCSVGSASGVMIKGGYALSAGHVIREAKRPVPLVLYGGRRIQGMTLGANFDTDTGLIKVTTKGDFPVVEMGTSSNLKRGQWCVMLGHPGGWKKGRMASIRIGRILRNGRDFIVSDCTMTLGDSGGPLFDMQGRIIGINSRISGDLASNMHVPIDAFHRDWEVLVAGKTTGNQISSSFRGRGRGRSRPTLGIERDPDSEEIKVLEIRAGTPAVSSGLEVGDIIKRIDDQSVSSWRSIYRIIRWKRPGQKVKLLVERGKKTLEIPLTLGRRRR